MAKIQFKCICKHPDNEHNFDPESVMFGCLHTIIHAGIKNDGSPEDPEPSYCGCREFRPDTLKYVEEAYERRAKR